MARNSQGKCKILSSPQATENHKKPNKSSPALCQCNSVSKCILPELTLQAQKPGVVQHKNHQDSIKKHEKWEIEVELRHSFLSGESAVKMSPETDPNILRSD